MWSGGGLADANNSFRSNTLSLPVLANGAAVYSFLVTAFGSAALLGPVLTKALLAKGGYALAYNVFAALSLLALLLGSLV